ncbi:hypothetical protein M9H77_29709 [Catharanthus roseus]|uniref:Uncharacterized protein n=1 Tax=Catharanthus roseus TaxID=4058 RepID=A0ACB9ZWH4_CATRO|nr:hypothetical protein M9H77_29709 [Catharanthus roseus]
MISYKEDALKNKIEEFDDFGRIALLKIVLTIDGRSYLTVPSRPEDKEASMRNLEKQIGQLLKIVSERTQRTLLRNIEGASPTKHKASKKTKEKHKHLVPKPKASLMKYMPQMVDLNLPYVTGSNLGCVSVILRKNGLGRSD